MKHLSNLLHSEKLSCIGRGREGEKKNRMKKEEVRKKKHVKLPNLHGNNLKFSNKQPRLLTFSICAVKVNISSLWRDTQTDYTGCQTVSTIFSPFSKNGHKCTFWKPTIYQQRRVPYIFK